MGRAMKYRLTLARCPQSRKNFKIENLWLMRNGYFFLMSILSGDDSYGDAHSSDPPARDWT